MHPNIQWRLCMLYYDPYIVKMILQFGSNIAPTLHNNLHLIPKYCNISTHRVWLVHVARGM